MHLEISFGKWRQFYLGHNVLKELNVLLYGISGCNHIIITRYHRYVGVDYLLTYDVFMYSGLIGMGMNSLVRLVPYADL